MIEYIKILISLEIEIKKKKTDNIDLLEFQFREMRFNRVVLNFSDFDLLEFSNIFLAFGSGLS